MNELTKEELNNVQGGLLRSVTTWGLIGAGITFIIGIIDGYIRPLPCNSSK